MKMLNPCLSSRLFLWCARDQEPVKLLHLEKQQDTSDDAAVSWTALVLILVMRKLIQ